MHAFRTLIVDDDAGCRYALEALLRGQSFNNIDHATNGVEALKLLIRRQYDLIFLDVQMPAMTGLEFLRRCKCGDVLSGTAVFLMTGEADSETVKIIQAEALKVDDFLAKPASVDAITARTNRLLRSKKVDQILGIGHICDLPGNATKGMFLSFSMDIQGDTAFIKLFGFFLRDDRNIIRDLADSIFSSPAKSIVLDFANVLMIDAFGLGTLLLIGGVARMANKRLGIVFDERTVGKRLVTLGVPQFIPVVARPAAV